MSHVDDGTLHALVDDALDATARLEVEAHLASCGECARRFAEAMAMARQVTTLLGALDDVGGSVRIVALSVTPAAPAVADPARKVTPIGLRFVTLRRVAIAASVLVVAGVSYQVGQRGDASRRDTVVLVSTKAPARSAPMVATPSVVDVPADSYVAAPSPSVRQRLSGGPRTEAEIVSAGRADQTPRKSAVDAAAAIAPAAPPAVSRRLPAVSVDVVRDSTEQRSREAQASSDALGRVQAQEQARAQQGASAPEQRSRLGERPSRLESVVVTSVGASATPQAASGNAAAPAAKSRTPKVVPLAGYTAADEESVPGVTRRRYVSSSGTPLLLLITQPLPEVKAQRSQDASSEFIVSTANGRSTVRWHARGLDYELQAPLAPDSLMKLATQLR